MSNPTSQKGGLQGENGGHACRQNDGKGGTFCPGGSKTKYQEPSDASKTDEVEKRGSFLRHILMHFSRNVPLFVERRFDLAHFKTGMSGVTGLHDHGGNQARQNAEGEADGENRFFPKEEPGKKNRGNEEDEGHGKMVRHDVDVFGLKKAGIDAHRGRMA